MFTDKELREGGPPQTYDWTMRSNFRSCGRKLYWFLRGADYASIPAYFTFGKAWQAILDKWYVPQVTVDWSPSQIKEHIARAIENGRKVWQEDAPVEFGVNTWDNLILLFQWYRANHPIESWRVVAMEQGWEYPLAGTPYFLGGSLDGYLEWKPYGLALLENKALGVYLTDKVAAQFAHSGQITQYIWYLTKLLGKEIFCALINMASKRIAKTKGCSENQFMRSPEQRSAWQLEQFEEEVLVDISDVEREWERWKWPRTTNSIECVGGIGKSPCLFRPLCLAEAPFYELDPTSYEGIVWRKGPWAPWKRSGGCVISDKNKRKGGEEK